MMSRHRETVLRLSCGKLKPNALPFAKRKFGKEKESTMRALPPDESPLPQVLDVVQDQQGRKGVVFRIRDIFPGDTEPVHVVTSTGDEVWYHASELTVLGKAIQD
jgi:hypothetical protein